MAGDEGGQVREFEKRKKQLVKESAIRRAREDFTVAAYARKQRVRALAPRPTRARLRAWILIGARARVTVRE